ncbi:hypothetical protein ABER23_09760 [Paenibacillus lautus]|uniref:hypothetical protein n=1 Tax=Paenibacillus lautus TaxID=1401 RepID=UPI003D2BCF0B
MKIMQWLDQEMDGHFSIMNFSYVEITSSFTVMVCNLLSRKKEPVEISRQALFIHLYLAHPIRTGNLSPAILRNLAAGRSD